MFGALGRWFKTVWYLFSGRIDSARVELDKDPHVVRAKYEDIIRDKRSRIQQYKDAVATLIAQQETKIEKVKTLTKEVNRLESLKAGAGAKAKDLVEKLKNRGMSLEAIKLDPDYRQCLSAFNDFTSTLNEKNNRIVELEGDIQEYGQTIGSHKIQLQQLQREIEGLKGEAADAVADMISSKESEQLSDLLAGISQDSKSKELEDLRALRGQVKAEAKIAGELAGTDTRVQEAEFLKFAEEHESNDEFEALIGIAASVEKPAAEKTAPEAETKLPE
jgi:chromosome segregation ATPase